MGAMGDAVSSFPDFLPPQLREPVLVAIPFFLLLILGIRRPTARRSLRRPWQLPSDQWYTWVIAVVGVDLLFYGYHGIAHRVRLAWPPIRHITSASTTTSPPRPARGGTSAARS